MFFFGKRKIIRIFAPCYLYYQVDMGKIYYVARAEERKENTRKMKTGGMSVELISKYTNFAAEEIANF